MKKYNLLLILNILNIFQLYSQGLPALLPDPGTQIAVSDYGPRNVTHGTLFHCGIDYPTPLNNYRTAVEGGTIRGFGSHSQDGAMMSFGNWGYRHMQRNATADRHWEFWTNPINGIEYLILRADGPNNTHTTTAIYTVAPSTEVTVIDPFTGNTVAISTQFNQYDICFAAGPYSASAPHLHLERRNEQTENPFLWVTHIDTQNPIVNIRYFYPENGHAIQFPTNNNNNIYGNNVIITSDINVIIDKDLDIVNYHYRRNYQGNQNFVYIYQWQYTGGSLGDGNVRVLNSEALILEDLRNPIHSVVYPFGQVASHDFFKFGWEIQQRQGSGEPIYPDGKYTVRVRAYDIRNHLTNQNSEVIIDNFRPFIKKVTIEQKSGIIYNAEWNWSGGGLTINTSTDNESKGDKDLTIKIITSEPLKSLIIDIPNLNIKDLCTSLDDDNIKWKYEIKKDKFKICKEDIKKLNGKIPIDFWGRDLSNNQLEGFTENEDFRAASAIPLHLSNGDWNPQPTPQHDKRHYLRINIESLTGFWESVLEELGACMRSPRYLLLSRAKGGRPFEDGEPYRFSWETKSISSSQMVSLTVTDQFCDETINSEVMVCPPGTGCPVDPNDIIGPEGYGEQRWVSKTETLPYRIRYENDPVQALGPAQKVVVRYPVDKNANMYSVELGEFGFGDFRYQIPPKTINYSARLNVVDSLGVYVDVIAGLDIAKKEVFWIFQSIDPQTGIKPYFIDLGFLPKNDSITHRGEGFVSFSIKPLLTAHTGDTISAQADIVFDQNEAILTNKVFNTIDALPPSTWVKPLPPFIDSTNFRVSFKGNDDMGGSGILKYDLYVSENKGAYWPYQTIPGDTSIIYSGKMGNSYDFFTRASDNVYNREKLKNIAEASIAIIPKNLIVNPNSNSHFCIGNKLPIIWRSCNLYALDIEISSDNAKSFVSIAKNVNANDTSFIWDIPKDIDFSKDYSIRILNSLNKLPLDTSQLFRFFDELKVDAGIDKLVCNNDSVQIGGNPSASNGVEPYSYKWLTSMGLSSYNVSNPYAYYENAYVLESQDYYGCWNRDTVVVSNSNVERITLYGIDERYCLQASPDTLKATPTGGIFSGLGIIDNVFYPNIAGSGNHSITYTHTNSNGCKKDTTVYVEVLEQSLVTISDVLTDYCTDSDTVHLGANPAGGIFSGDGVIDTLFIPSSAGSGLHRIKYTYPDINGCISIYEFDINVHAKPELLIEGIENSYCINSPADTINGFPAGGIFDGIGLTNNIFNPSIAGAGNHQVTYSYTSQYGCSNSVVATTIVNDLPVVTISGLNDRHCENSTPVTVIGTPSNGVFEGDGINDGKFYPSIAGVGIHAINYTYTDANMCSNTASKQVEVVKKPSVTFFGLDDSYCINSGIVNLTGKPTGGHFSGNGITGNTFSTSVAGIGTHIVSYSYTDSNGCSNDTSKSVKVNPLPSIYLGRDTSITTVEAITLDAGSGYTNYSWSDGSTGQTLTLDGAILGKGIHKVWVEVSDDNSCTAADTIQVEVTDNVGIDMFSSKVKLQVYPNPSSGLFNLEIENSSSENIYVEIRNNAGQLVYSKKFKGRYEDIKTEINLGGFAKGVYYINVKVKRERVTRKIVII